MGFYFIGTSEGRREYCHVKENDTLDCKRAYIALQKTPFCIVKDALLQRNRCPLTMQKGTFHDAKGHQLNPEREFFLQ